MDLTHLGLLMLLAASALGGPVLLLLLRSFHATRWIFFGYIISVLLIVAVLLTHQNPKVIEDSGWVNIILVSFGVSITTAGLFAALASIILYFAIMKKVESK